MKYITGKVIFRKRWAATDELTIETETLSDAKLGEPVTVAFGECEWKADEDGNYHADCGGLHIFIDGGPSENKHKFCPYCGRTIKTV